MVAKAGQTDNRFACRDQFRVQNVEVGGTYTIIGVKYALYVLLTDLFVATLEDARTIEEVFLDQQQSDGPSERGRED